MGWHKPVSLFDTVTNHRAAADQHIADFAGVIDQQLFVGNAIHQRPVSVIAFKGQKHYAVGLLQKLAQRPDIKLLVYAGLPVKWLVSLYRVLLADYVFQDTCNLIDYYAIATATGQRHSAFKKRQNLLKQLPGFSIGKRPAKVIDGIDQRIYPAQTIEVTLLKSFAHKSHGLNGCLKDFPFVIRTKIGLPDLVQGGTIFNIKLSAHVLKPPVTKVKVELFV